MSKERKQELLKRIIEIERFFCNNETNESSRIRSLLDLLRADRLNELQEIVDKYPTSESLFTKLIEKLKDKSVYKTLKKITESQGEDESTLKGLFSLGTHVAIEIEHGSKEYGILLPIIHERIGKIVFGK